MSGQFSNDIEELLGPVSGTIGLPAAVAPNGAGSDVMIAGGAYEGADQFDRTLAMWSPPYQPADADIIPEKPIMDARVRDIIRNDAYISGGAAIHRDNIVGAAFLLNSKPNTHVLGLDDKWAEEFQEEVEAKFTLWAESPNNWPDAARHNSLTAMVRLAVSVYLSGGEVLASVEWLRDLDRPFNTAIQMIDADRLSNPYGDMDSPTLRGGIERNMYGAPQAYNIRMAHPGDHTTADGYFWKRVPKFKPWGRLQMIHIFEQERADQSRGLSNLVSALKEMRMTKKFRDIVLQNAVINASFAASIESDLPSDAVYQALGAGNAKDMGKHIGGYANAYLGEVAKYTKNGRAAYIDGVKIPHLYPGTKLQLRPAGQGGPLGTDFEQSLLRYLAANLGVSYEQLSKDYSRTNYSSARAAMTETWKGMQARKKIVAEGFANHVFRLWFEEAFNKGEITSLPRNAPGLYDGLNMDAYTQAEWIGASRGQIDELKETQAAVLRLKYGLATREDELGRLGKDWRKVFAQLEREEAVAKSRGLVFTEDDNMMNAATGAPREKEGKGEKDDGSEDNTDV